MKAEEYDAIRGEIYPPRWQDPGLIPECLVLALDVLAAIAITDQTCACPTGLNVPRNPECPVLHVDPVEAAEQALRRMVQRATTGVPIYEARDIRG